MSDFITCETCTDGSCGICHGDGGYETPAAPPFPAKWNTCTECMGLCVCQACFGQVTTPNPYAHAILPILPNPQETWKTMLFSTFDGDDNVN